MDSTDHVLRDLRRKNTLVASLQERNERLEEATRAYQGTVREAQRLQADAQQTAERQAASTEKYRRKYHDAVKTIRDQQALVETLHAQLREREEQTELYKRKYARAKKQNMALLQQMQQYDEYVQQINKQKQQLQQDVQRLQTADTEKQSEARTKSDLVASLEATVQSLEVELQQRDRQIKSFRRQLQGPAPAPLVSSSAIPAATRQSSTLHQPRWKPSTVLLDETGARSRFGGAASPASFNNNKRPAATASAPIIVDDSLSLSVSDSVFHQRTAPFHVPTAAAMQHHQHRNLQHSSASRSPTTTALEAALDEHIQRFERGLRLDL